MKLKLNYIILYKYYINSIGIVKIFTVLKK